MRRPIGMMTRRARAGFTLVELMIAMVMAGIVMGAVYQLLAKNQRFYRAQSQITSVQQNIRTVTQVLPGDLRELAASQGDIIAMGDSSITIRAMRGFAIVCATPNVATGDLIIRNGLAFGYRSPDPTRDSLLVFYEGDSSVASDDRWLIGGLQSLTTGSVCADGAAGTTLRMTGPFVADFDSVRVGAPVRAFETVRYEYYQDAGSWWLGVQSMVGGSWTAMSPVAGPLLTGGGLRFTYYDVNGAVTAVPANVVSIEIAVKGQSATEISAEGRPRGYYQDSLRVRVALRNN